MKIQLMEGIKNLFGKKISLKKGLAGVALIATMFSVTGGCGKEKNEDANLPKDEIQTEIAAKEGKKGLSEDTQKNNHYMSFEQFEQLTKNYMDLNMQKGNMLSKEEVASLIYIANIDVLSEEAVALGLGEANVTSLGQLVDSSIMTLNSIAMHNNMVNDKNSFINYSDMFYEQKDRDFVKNFDEDLSSLAASNYSKPDYYRNAIHAFSDEIKDNGNGTWSFQAGENIRLILEIILQTHLGYLSSTGFILTEETDRYNNYFKEFCSNDLMFIFSVPNVINSLDPVQLNLRFDIPKPTL